MSRDEWPPGEVAAEPFLTRPAPSSPTPTPASAKKQKPAQKHCITGGRPIGRYAAGWKAGFTAGAIDALRLLCREVDDPIVWTAAHHLSARGGDD